MSIGADHAKEAGRHWKRISGTFNGVSMDM